VDVASGLNIAAFNVGIALGAWGGGIIVAHFGLMATPSIGALVVGAALLLTWLAGALDRRDAVGAPDAGERIASPDFAPGRD
jgi:predicted MFS family arabinose efflux permease